MTSYFPFTSFGSELVRRIWKVKEALWPSPMPQRPKMPLELFYHVLDAVYEANDIPTLCTCTLLSRATHRHARSLLFKNVSVSTREAFFALEDALTKSQVNLPGLVASLSINLNFDSPFGLTEFHLAHLVTICPNLQNISISIFGCEPVFTQAPHTLGVKDRPAPSLSEKALKLLSLSTKMTSLEVANWSDNAEILLQLLRVWPQVKRLSVSGTIPCIPNPIVEPLVFKDLETLSITAHTSPFVVVLQRLLFDALGTALRELSLGPETDNEIMDCLTASTLASVESLSLPSNDAKLVAVLKRCPSLRRLKIERPVLTPEFADAIPDSLEALALGVESSQHIQLISRVISDRRGLRKVCIRPWASVDCGSIVGLCRSKGIELLVCRTTKSFEGC